MDKNIKLSIIGASVIALLGAGGVYYRIEQLQQKRDYFESKFEKTKAMLPKAVSFEKTSKSSLFSTDSKYIIQLIKDGKKSDSRLVINTHLNHGIGYLFSGIIKGHSIGIIEGPFTKEFITLDKLFDSDIKVLSDDTLITDTKFVDLIAKDGTEIKGVTSYIEATKDDDNLKTNFKIANLSSPKNPEGKPLFNLNGFALSYSGKSNQISNNHFSLTLNEVKSPFAQINNLDLAADSVVKSGAVDMTSSLRVAKINAAQWKNGSVDFKYSVLGLDESALNKIYLLGQKSAPNNDQDIEKDINAMETEFKKIFMHGLSVNIDKLFFKSGEDSFNFTFNSSLPKSARFEDVSFEKNVTMSYKLETKGNLSHIIATEINNKLQAINTKNNDTVAPPTQQITVINNALNVSFDIKNGKAQLNNKDLPVEQQDVLHIILSTIDKKMHAPKPVVSSTDMTTQSSMAKIEVENKAVENK